MKSPGSYTCVGSKHLVARLADVYEDTVLFEQVILKMTSPINIAMVLRLTKLSTLIMFFSKHAFS